MEKKKYTAKDADLSFYVAEVLAFIDRTDQLTDIHPAFRQKVKMKANALIKEIETISDIGLRGSGKQAQNDVVILSNQILDHIVTKRVEYGKELLKSKELGQLETEKYMDLITR